MLAMALKLTIASAGDEPLPPGSPLRIELRDTSYADAPAKLLKRVDTTVVRKGRTTTVAVSMDEPVPDGLLAQLRHPLRPRSRQDAR